MPRKRENGLGSFGFKERSKKDLHKGKISAAGIYPRDRQYGSLVTRTVIEKMDLDSEWVKWRKGYEYYNRAAWYVLEEYDPVAQEYRKAQLPSKLFQGTDGEIDVIFEGYKFATQTADSNNHYVMKRVLNEDADWSIGRITEIRNDFYYDFDKSNPEYTFYKRQNMILCKLDVDEQAPACFEMIGDRITDGETEATLSFILDKDQHPGLYLGKQYSFNPEFNFPSKTTIEVEIPLSSVEFTEGIEENWNWSKIVGELIYLPDTFVKRSVTDPNLTTYEYLDANKYFGVNAEYESQEQTPILALDLTDSILPPTLFDLTEMSSLFTATGTYDIKGAWLFKKSLYQPYFGKQYLTADVVEEKVNRISFNLLPFKVAGFRLTDRNTVILESIEFVSDVKLYTDLTDGFLAFDSRSFTKKVVDEYKNADGSSRYYHRDYLPVYDKGVAQPLQGKEILRYEKAPIWHRLETDTDPWSDEVWTNGENLKPAELFACSCPSYSKSQLRAPEATESDGVRRANRQKRYPMPSVESRFDFEGIGTNQVAGAMQTWETVSDRMKFRMCKHTIAAMFIEYIKTAEPSGYQSIESRLKFEEKLKADMEEVAEEFKSSYQRGGISTLEILFAMGNVLNLNTVEQANIILQSHGQSGAINDFTRQHSPKDDNFRLRL